MTEEEISTGRTALRIMARKTIAMLKTSWESTVIRCLDEGATRTGNSSDGQIGKTCDQPVHTQYLFIYIYILKDIVIIRQHELLLIITYISCISYLSLWFRSQWLLCICFRLRVVGRFLPGLFESPVFFFWVIKKIYDPITLLIKIISIATSTFITPRCKILAGKELI